jgi:hypothetical protein
MKTEMRLKSPFTLFQLVSFPYHGGRYPLFRHLTDCKNTTPALSPARFQWAPSLFYRLPFISRLTPERPCQPSRQPFLSALLLFIVVFCSFHAPPGSCTHHPRRLHWRGRNKHKKGEVDLICDTHIYYTFIYTYSKRVIK